MDTISVTNERIAQRITALCQRLEQEQVDVYLVPSADSHLNEYVSVHQQRRAAISNFTGSAGDALISRQGSHVFADSRYYLQADQEVDPALFHIHKVGMEGEQTLTECLRELEKERGSLRVGYDPFVVAMDMQATYTKSLKAADSALVPISGNLVDAVWENRSVAVSQPIYLLSDAETGRSVADKLSAVRKEMDQEEAAVLILTKLDEIAWLTNLRGSDVSYNPVFEAYMVIEHERATCFTRLTPEPEIQDALVPHVTFAPYEAYTETLQRIGTEISKTSGAGGASGKIWLDPSGTTMGTRLLLPEGQQIHEARNPVVLMKALKNEVEIAASRDAHKRAAAAKIRSLARMERARTEGQVVSEKAYAQMLSEEYAREEGYRDLSFTTISAVGANGAIVHYGGANDEVALRDGELFLVDSGTQMGAGTTDDTRTICIGTPTARQQQLYTLVLRCHIQLARQKFPDGTSGVALDALTRSQMWNAGLDYGHGTGHGVGALLNVHEGPQRVAPRGSDEPLQPGMIISNEPGYYEAGWGGIRLENLYVVTVDETLPEHPSGKKWYQLDTLTLIPFDHRLIDWEQLSEPDRDWLAAYHRQVLETIQPVLSDGDQVWLRAACEPFL